MTKPCPVCLRLPKLVQLEVKGRGSSWTGASLAIYVFRCRNFLWKRHTITTKQKGVCCSDPWWRWKEDLIDEWNDIVENGSQYPVYRDAHKSELPLATVKRL